MTYKVFISQPMKGRTEEEILKERDHIFASLIPIVDEHLVLLDTFFTEHDPNNKMASLSKSIMKMGEADLVVFAPNWAKARGCWCEYVIACAYEKRLLFFESIKRGFLND